MNLQTLLRTYDAVVIFDTETSGLDAEKNQIIELAAIRVEAAESGLPRIADSMDDFIKLPEGELLDPKIAELTHITDGIFLRFLKPAGLCVFANFFLRMRLSLLAFLKQKFQKI